MRKVTSILLIALFATAVCADELKSAGAGWRVDAVEQRATLVERIRSNLRQMVKPTLALQLVARPLSVVPVSTRPACAELPRVAAPSAQPFQFRLPPPLI